MVDISFEIQGEAVEPHDMKDALDVMFLEHLINEISNRLGSLLCKKHGLEPKIKVKGQSLDTLNYEITGCCNDIINEARKKLK
jgi:hypothetical protein